MKIIFVLKITTKNLRSLQNLLDHLLQRDFQFHFVFHIQ